MTAQDKLAEAYFFMQQLKEPINALQASYFFSAYLSAINSIFDHLLEDANQKFYLGFSLDDYLDYRKFRTIAEFSGNVKARQFIEWYDDIFNTIHANVVGKLFRVERNRNIHKRIEPPKLFAEMKPENLENIDTVTTIEFVHNLSFEEAKKHFDDAIHEYITRINENRLKNNRPMATTIISSLGFRFPDNPQMSLNQICEKFYELMATVVDQSKKYLN